MRHNETQLKNHSPEAYPLRAGCRCSSGLSSAIYGPHDCGAAQPSCNSVTLEKALRGVGISIAEARALSESPLDELCSAADLVRRERCGEAFDLCAIVNAKSGRCSEDCAFCAQSSHHRTNISEYSLLSADELAEAAMRARAGGALRFSIVTSGGALNEGELDLVCFAIDEIRRRAAISVCLSLGLLSEKQFRRLKSAGAERIHNNLESSKSYFSSICTTHRWEEKCEAIEAAQSAGLSVCSGGIIGLGESLSDRIEMAAAIRELGVSSVPVNILNPIHGTPLEGAQPLPYSEVLRTLAIFRLMMPGASIRMAGGRALLPDRGFSCFSSGANAAITGDMLTTSGVEAGRDLAMLKKLGYEVKKID